MASQHKKLLDQQEQAPRIFKKRNGVKLHAVIANLAGREAKGFLESMMVAGGAKAFVGLN